MVFLHSSQTAFHIPSKELSAIFSPQNYLLLYIYLYYIIIQYRLYHIIYIFSTLKEKNVDKFEITLEKTKKVCYYLYRRQKREEFITARGLPKQVLK